MLNLLLVGCGGFLGSIARYSLSLCLKENTYATWLANFTGSLILGLLLYFYRGGLLTEGLWLFAGIGFSGAYTTFSTFSHESLQFILRKEYRRAGLYITASLLLSLSMVFLLLSVLP